MIMQSWRKRKTLNQLNLIQQTKETNFAHFVCSSFTKAREINLVNLKKEATNFLEKFLNLLNPPSKKSLTLSWKHAEDKYSLLKNTRAIFNPRLSRFILRIIFAIFDFCKLSALISFIIIICIACARTLYFFCIRHIFDLSGINYAPMNIHHNNHLHLRSVRQG